MFVTYFRCCGIFLGVVQHTVACMCLLWYFQSLSKCPTWFSLYCHMIQLWIPSDLVKARYTVTVHVCQVVLEPARCQELWHSNYVLFHKLGFMAYNVRQCQCAHNMYLPLQFQSFLSSWGVTPTFSCWVIWSSQLMTEKCLRNPENLLVVGSCDT